MAVILTLLLYVIHVYGVHVTGTVVNDRIAIIKLHIRSDIRHRFSETLVTSQISNDADFPQDVRFDVRLPNEAFISEFAMLIDGVVYPGRVEEKAAANRRFEAAVQAGQSAGKVAAKSSRETNDFVVSINVAGSSHVTFNLTYQELLQRRMGLYEHVIHINPGEIVPDFGVEVYINESREITELSVPEIRGDRLTAAVITGTNRFAQIRSVSSNEAEIIFSPTPQQQRVYSSQGVAGQFIVNYDVDHTLNPEGEVLVSEGYFVHFFAPETLPVMGKRIMFVLDTSGSMGGRKNRQLIEALIFILEELRPEDEFGILLFSSGVRFWATGELIPASPENIARAKAFANTIPARGGTNINDALVWGLTVLSYHDTKPSMILFLTDGQATAGVTSYTDIVDNVRKARHLRQSIHSLAFGTGADFSLLRKISAQNQGFARKIFEDADAALQLSGFYNEISSPVLSEVFMLYIGDLVDKTSLTQSQFTTVYSGSEVVIAGRYNTSVETPEQLTVIIEGNKASGYAFYRNDYTITPLRPQFSTTPSTTSSTIPTPQKDRKTSFIERLWVYLTIKQLIEKTIQQHNATIVQQRRTKDEALRLSLRYQFVTPYTSMVVTKPDSLQVNSTLGTRAPPPVSGGGFTTTTTTTTTHGPRQGLPFPGITPPRTTTTTRHPPAAFTTTRIFPTFTGNFVPSTTRPFTTPPATRHTTPTFPTTTPPFRRTSTRSGTVFTTGIFVPTTTTAVTTVAPQLIGFPPGFNIEVHLGPSMSQRGFLCLDISTTSQPSQTNIILLNDTTADLVMTGTLHTKTYDGLRKFESVEVSINGTEILGVSVKSVSIRGRSYRWWQLSSLNDADVTVTDIGGLHLTTAGNLSLTFHKYGIETRRSLSSPFITVAVRNTDNLSFGTLGVIGSVLGMRALAISPQDTLTFNINGVQKTVTISTDKLQDGAECYRITDKVVLAEILGL